MVNIDSSETALSENELDLYLEIWARWCNDHGELQSSISPLVVVANRARVELSAQDKRKRLAAELGMLVSDPRLDEHVPWMSARETRTELRQGSTRHHEIAEVVDVAVKRMRQHYNEPAKNRVAGYGDLLLDALMLHLGITARQLPRMRSIKTISEELSRRHRKPVAERTARELIQKSKFGDGGIVSYLNVKRLQKLA